jgi:hypothetical protein
VPQRRLGAYVLPGDTVWLEKTLTRTYPLLDALVVPVPADGVGWNGHPIPVEAALAIIRRVDTRGILSIVDGRWVEPTEPMRGETAQRQAAIDALAGTVDWVLQLDGDELLPEPDALFRAIDAAEEQGLRAVEWPMRVLFRRTRRWVFEVVGRRREPRYDYPGAIVVRPGIELLDARRVAGDYLRAVVDGDRSSLQIARPAEAGEHRWEGLRHEEAVIHNSWARSPHEIRQKVRSWGHANDVGGGRYYWLRWYPSPVTWRYARNLHPFARGLWPRLSRTATTGELD